MKQEFVSARWMLYEGLHATRVHFSDRDVTLLNTLDYPTLGLPIEQVKAAYRIAYSLLDKIAYFLNDYAKLGMNARQVYFKTVWHENGDFRKGIRASLRDSKNLPLRGLF
jgi:HEPN superfamily protein